MDKLGEHGGGEGLGSSGAAPGGAVGRPFFERPSSLIGGVDPGLARLVSNVRTPTQGEPPYLHRDNPFAVAAAELKERLDFAQRGYGREGEHRLSALEDALWDRLSIRSKPARLECFEATNDHEAMVRAYLRWAELLAHMGMDRAVVSNTQAAYTGYRRDDLAQRIVNYARDASALRRIEFLDWKNAVEDPSQFRILLEEGYHEVRLVPEKTRPTTLESLLEVAEPKHGGQPRRERILEELQRRGLWPPSK